MIVKEREQSVQLETMLALSRRGNLLNPQKTHIRQMVKGYEGECQFDDLLRQLTCECLILNDLVLKINSQTCQIDTLMISSKGISLYEVKNFEGEFVYRDDKLKIYSSNKEISNPMHQLTRTAMLFRQLMEEQQVNFTLHSYVVFINEQFTLLQAPMNEQLILPTRIPYHLKKLNSERGSLNKSHYRFGEILKQMHLTDVTYMTLPEYSYENLKKGVFCKTCSTEMSHAKGRMWQCTKCGQEKVSYNAIFDQIKDFNLLFPEKKYKTSEMHEWTGRFFSKKSIRTVLSNQYTLKGKNKGAYYE